MATLEEIVRTEVRWYAGGGEGHQARLFPILDDKQKMYAVVVVDYPAPNSYKGTGDVVVMARIYRDKVIVEVDYTDKPLFQRLMNNHDVPRDRIILAYAGESTDGYFERLPLPGYNFEKLTEDEPTTQPTGD
jgi:hypothetical protein